jgi:hypothetical protein
VILPSNYFARGLHILAEDSEGLAAQINAFEQPRAIAADYTVVREDHMRTIEVDTTAADVTITVPGGLWTDSERAYVVVRKVAGANDVLIEAGAAAELQFADTFADPPAMELLWGQLTVQHRGLNEDGDSFYYLTGQLDLAV